MPVDGVKYTIVTSVQYDQTKLHYYHIILLMSIILLHQHLQPALTTVLCFNSSFESFMCHIIQTGASLRGIKM